MTDYKYSFANDYSELAHPEIIEAFAAVGAAQFVGYGEDEHCQEAVRLIRTALDMPDADVHFSSGGTQANLIVLSALMRPFEAVIAMTLGHINTHETGAIEATGHKVFSVPGVDGKLLPSAIQQAVDYHSDEHMVKPRVVYISQSTELGSVYTRDELAAISECCRANGLYLYVDGARLGAAINSAASDLDYASFARLVDAFYIGGTKNGAMYGEAIVICRDELKPDFRFFLKQRGALLGKVAAMGIQFKALFADGLYDRLAQHANYQGARLASGLTALGYEFLCPPETNQVFPILPTETALRLHELYDFHDWEEIGDKTVVRFVASWATPPEMVDLLLADLAEL